MRVTKQDFKADIISEILSQIVKTVDAIKDNVLFGFGLMRNGHDQHRSEQYAKKLIRITVPVDNKFAGHQ
jgi:uncharacterized lipoprotein YddW (UPF0748 family)